MRIDSHQHFWNYDPQRHAWISDQMKVIKRDFTPVQLKALLEEHQLDGCIAVQADQSEQETAFLLDLVEKHDFIKAVVGWVDLSSEDLKERLAYFSSFKKFKGVRHVIQDEPLGFMNRSDFQRGIKALESFGLTYDILIKPPQLAETIAMTQNFPNQKFVLDHIAKPQISKAVNQEWSKGIYELAKHPNLYCKLSGMVTETDQYQWQQQDFKEFLLLVTDAFGVDRLMFGSDWPVCLLAASYKEVMELITDFYSLTDLDKIMGANAMKFYNL